MKKFFEAKYAIVTALLAAVAYAADVKISELPLTSNPSSIHTLDSFPYVDSSGTPTTKRFQLSDLPSTPAFVTKFALFAPLNNPLFTGVVKLKDAGSAFAVQLLAPSLSATWTLQFPANAGTNGYVLSTNGSGVTSWIPASSGSGTVTSVGISVPASSLFGVSGSPVTTSGTIALTTTGTSGGVPYFSSSSQLASSSVLTANQLLLGGGAGSPPASLGSLGTSTTVLHGNVSGVPSFSQISNGDVSSSAAIDFSKLAALSSANILVGNVSNVASSVSMSGDVTISNAGVTAIGANKVTNSQLATMAAHTFKGNNTGSTANPIDLTTTQLTAELNAFTSSLKGLAPSSGGGTTNFLRADGSWAAPPSGGTPAGSTGDVQFNDSGSFGADTGGFDYSLSNHQLSLTSIEMVPQATRWFTIDSPLGQASPVIEIKSNGSQVSYITDLGDAYFHFANFVTGIDVGNIQSSGGTTVINNAFNPANDNSYDLGSGALGWRKIYTHDITTTAAEIGSQLTLGSGSSILWGAGSGSVTIALSGTSSSTWNLTLPSDPPGASSILTEGTNGTISYLNFNSTSTDYLGGDGAFHNLPPSSPNLSAVLTSGNSAGSQSITDLTTIAMNGSSSGILLLSPPSSLSNYTFTFPSDDGTSGYFLQASGGGNTSWQPLPSPAAAGSTNDVQFNSSGVLAADTGVFTYDPGSHTLNSTNISGTNGGFTDIGVGDGVELANSAFIRWDNASHFTKWIIDTNSGGDNTWTWPSSAPMSTSLLQVDSSGNVSFGGAPGGSVTSVGFSVPSSSIFGVSGSPVTTSGTLGMTTTGTSGGIPYFSSSSQLSSSAALTNHAIVLGGGAGATPVALGSLGTTTTVLHGNASGNPSFGAVSLTSGADVSGTLPVGNGGTGATSLTVHGVVVGNSTSAVNVTAAGTAGQVLTSNGASADPTFQTTSAGVVIYASPTTQIFTSSSGTYNKNYTFVITSGSATAGATYTNNSITFTVYATVASATKVVLNGSGAPLTSGTLTKTGGTGDSTLTFSQVLAPLYLHVKLVGAGGGGAGSGISGAGSGGTGGNTTFGSSLLTGNGGVGGSTGGDPGAGGTASVASPAITILAQTGGRGGAATFVTSAGLPGAFGGSAAYFVGGGGAISTGSVGITGTANSGGGGGGAGNSAGFATGSGGAAGGFVEAIIPSPSATYAWAVGAGGSGGAPGTSGFTGGSGAAGQIIVIENYQ